MDRFDDAAFDVAQGRRTFLTGLAGLALFAPFAGSAWAQGSPLAGLLGGSSSGGLKHMLAQASDASLDKLAQPGAFYDDPNIRIGLPMLGKSRGILSALGTADQLGLTQGIVRKLNDAAGQAAQHAKPIFRTAIDELSIEDVPGIVRRSDGASQYLRRSAGTELKGSLRPLVNTALQDLGAYGQMDGMTRRSPLLAQAGFNRDTLANSVTDQALNGIFSYIGAEEGRIRANPLGAAGGLLKGLGN